mmetsp:Transcript_619/g.459  ORF Transcript_619/g.459 Transcript_619/m.459 type:complete len:230 (+) Transcript_619:306-995(+)
MAAKRITRRQLLKEPDKFLTFSHKVLNFVMENKAWILGGLVFVFVTIFGSYGFNLYSAKNEKKAAAMLEDARNLYAIALYSDSPETSYNKVKNNFNILFKKFSHTAAARIGSLIYANICYQTKDYDTANSMYQKALSHFDKKKSALKNTILSGMAYCSQQKQEYTEAIRLFKMIEKSPYSILKEDALFNIGLLYEQIGKTDKSYDAFNKLISEYKNSIYIDLVKERIKT